MQNNGASLRDVIDVAVKQAFHHSEMAHRDFQAICDPMKLAENFGSREQICIHAQGIRTAGGPSGDRMKVTSLPDSMYN